MVNENTIGTDTQVLSALDELREGIQSIHNRLGYLERTGNKSDPAVSSELTQLRQAYRGLESKLDEVVLADKSEGEQVAYLKEQLRLRGQDVTPQPKEEIKPDPQPVSEIGDPAAYYLMAVEPDILDAAFDEKLIYTNRGDALTDVEKETLRKLGPRKVITPTIAGFQSYKREYIKNIKDAAEKGGETPPKSLGQTPRPLGANTPGKLRPMDLASMTPEQVKANKEQLFAQLGI